MRDGVPVPGSARARLIEQALVRFGARGFDDVGVTEIAEAAGVTVGSLYHHFVSKAGLYRAVRTDVERRVADRMAGAAEVADRPLAAALLVGFDYLTRVGYAGLIGERHPMPEPGMPDAIAAAVAELTGDALVARLILAAWREALLAAAGDAGPQAARAALESTLASAGA